MADILVVLGFFGFAWLIDIVIHRLAEGLSAKE
jgi:hypothetical protein